jgi:isocitrate dehydrogenase (NAD+)
MTFQSVPGVVECLKVVTRDNCERLSRYAFNLAKREGRKKVTTIHKANIM